MISWTKPGLKPLIRRGLPWLRGCSVSLLFLAQERSLWIECITPNFPGECSGGQTVGTQNSFLAERSPSAFCCWCCRDWSKSVSHWVSSFSFAGCTKLSSCSSPSGFSSPTPCSSTCPPRSSSLPSSPGCRSAGAAWSTCSSGWPWSAWPVSRKQLVRVPPWGRDTPVATVGQWCREPLPLTCCLWPCY